MMNHPTNHPNHDTDAEEEYDAYGERFKRDLAELRRIERCLRFNDIRHIFPGA